LEILRKLMDRDMNAGLADLKQLQALAQTQVRDLRTFLHSMRPVDVDGANLVATARRAAESFQKESGIPVTFLGTNSPVGLPAEMTLEVLQMVREALHNVQKHAGATRVAVAMEKTDRGLEISVDDNGHGFGFAGSYSLEELELLRLGPASLKRRARAVNAGLVLGSAPGAGELETAGAVVEGGSGVGIAAGARVGNQIQDPAVVKGQETRAADERRY